MAVATTTVLLATLVLAAASAGVGTYAAIEQGKAAEKAAKYNAAVEKNNALTAQREAQYAAERIRKRNRLIQGKQRAGFAKSGVDLSGSAESVILDSAIEGELDAQARLYAGLSSSQAHQARAKLFRFEGATAKSASRLRAAGIALGGASSIASAGTQSYSSYNNPEF